MVVSPLYIILIGWFMWRIGVPWYIVLLPIWFILVFYIFICFGFFFHYLDGRKIYIKRNGVKVGYIQRGSGFVRY